MQCLTVPRTIDRECCCYDLLVRRSPSAFQLEKPNPVKLRHIFCTSCADELGLSRSSEANRHCPACGTDLPYPDDAVTTNLKPTEDYKTSVLSGLDPATIMECASRGLAFWTYQATQEVSVTTYPLFYDNAYRRQVLSGIPRQESHRQIWEIKCPS